MKTAKAPQPAAIELFFHDYCASSIGNWTGLWFPSKRSADKSRKKLLDEHGTDPDKEMDGTYGDVDVVNAVTVQLTAKGVLDFLQRYGAPSE